MRKIAAVSAIGICLLGVAFLMCLVGSFSQPVMAQVLSDNFSGTYRIVMGFPDPTATTGSVSGLGPTTATLNGTVSANGPMATVTFQYGLTTKYGSTASAGTLVGSMSQGVSASLTGLTCNTTYHFRVTAISVQGGGTTNGSDRPFTTGACP